METKNQILIRYDEAIIIRSKYCLLIHILCFLRLSVVSRQSSILDVVHIGTDVFIFI